MQAATSTDGSQHEVWESQYMPLHSCINQHSAELLKYCSTCLYLRLESKALWRKKKNFKEPLFYFIIIFFSDLIQLPNHHSLNFFLCVFFFLFNCIERPSTLLTAKPYRCINVCVTDELLWHRSHTRRPSRIGIWHLQKQRGHGLPSVRCRKWKERKILCGLCILIPKVSLRACSKCLE